MVGIFVYLVLQNYLEIVVFYWVTQDLSQKKGGIGMLAQDLL